MRAGDCGYHWRRGWISLRLSASCNGSVVSKVCTVYSFLRRFVDIRKCWNRKSSSDGGSDNDDKNRQWEPRCARIKEFRVLSVSLYLRLLTMITALRVTLHLHKASKFKTVWTSLQTALKKTIFFTLFWVFGIFVLPDVRRLSPCR